MERKTAPLNVTAKLTLHHIPGSDSITKNSLDKKAMIIICNWTKRKNYKQAGLHHKK